MTMKTIDDLAVAGQRVLVRDDLNVPVEGGRVTDDGRILAALTTVSALLDRGAEVIVCAHLGRPKGEPDPRYSLAPYAGGTSAVASALTGSGAFTLIGGGDTGAAIRALGFPESAFGFVSTGGGASLEFIEGKTLPGLAVLEDR